MPMKIDNRLPIKNTATDKTSAQPQNNTTAKPANALALTAGTIVKGTVLEYTGDGKALLDIGGRTVTAQTLVTLKPGSELLLEVKEGGTTPWLALAGKKGVAQEIVRLLFTEGANLTKAVALLTGSEKTATPSTLPPALLEAINNLHQEVAATATGDKAETNKLTQLLALLRPTDTQTSPAPLGQRISSTLQQLAGQIDSDRAPATELQTMAKFLDAHQQLNAHHAGKPPDFLLFPCFFAGNAGWGEWMFQMEEENGKGEEKQTTCSIDFFLQMSQLGDIRLKVFLKDSTIRGDFFVGTDSARTHLNKTLPQLVTILEGHDYHPVSLTVHPSAENLFHSFKRELEEKTNLKPFALIDVTA
ncbi:MAG: hypothetical protein OEL66_01570 [Desulfobulbaceae bacterium]|nr:hypothetical protein [Desulfobulbaceae bacterium]